VNKRSKVIVMGLGVNGLGVLRSMGMLGVECGGIYQRKDEELGIHSRFCRHVEQADKNLSDSSLWQCLNSLQRKLGDGPSVLIPSADRYAAFLCDNQEQLKKDYLVCMPSKEIHDAFLNKKRTAEICLSNDVPIPQTFSAESLKELDHIGKNLDYPAIIKPAYTFGSTFPGKNAVIGKSSELYSFYKRYPDLVDKTIIQSIIPSGDGNILVTASYSDSKGRVLGMYSGRKLRQYLPDYGVTCFGISESNDYLKELTKNFLENIGFKGFAALEFAHDVDRNQYAFIELNTRTYYHNQLFADAGVDLSKIAYLDLIGENFEAYMRKQGQLDGVHWLDFERDLASFYRKREIGDIGIAEWFFSLPKARSFAVWNRKDVKPFFKGVERLFTMIFNHSVKK